MTTIIDRRQNPSGRNFGNRQRFLDRAKSRLRQAIKDSIHTRSIEDTTSDERVVIPADNTQEPVFEHDHSTGQRSGVLPGNRKYVTGDTIPRPEEGAGGSGSEGSPDGEGEDSFAFILSYQEFLSLLFEDMALPDLVQKELHEITNTKLRRAGYTTTGSPNRMSLPRSTRQAIIRRKALKRPSAAAVEAVEEEIKRFETEDLAPPDGSTREEYLKNLRAQLEELRRRRSRIPWMDPKDLRFKRSEPQPEPIAQAVMFCLMDVSASMDEDMKGLAKRFFMLLHLFLTRHYEQVEVVFIRHTQRAEEVDEQTFFEGRQTGGTVVSTVLAEMVRIAGQRYPADEYNIYVAQASDGDNVRSDNDECVRLLREHVLPLSQYMAYVEIPRQRDPLIMLPQRESSLWKAYGPVAEEHAGLAMRRIAEARDIFPVFADLFKKRKESVT